MDRIKTFVKTYPLETLAVAGITTTVVILAVSNAKLTYQVNDARDYAQKALRALSAVDMAARDGGVPIEKLNALIQTAGLAVKEAV